MHALVGSVGALLPLVVLRACSSSARSDWNRGPYTSASAEFQPDSFDRYHSVAPEDLKAAAARMAARDSNKVSHSPARERKMVSRKSR
jgi:hypothetical protein